ncbi:MAG TPA: alpha/beta hydrolase-fold protein [Thermoanaerobaculia bacterium]|nr:alpha/beta hydrolase-fold protein [Thermoanaerobaculia bacterium]
MSTGSLLYTAHVPAGEGPFPTIILIHGWGASAHDLIGLAPMLHGGRALVLCPQGTVDVPLGRGETGHGWFPLVPGVPPDPQAFQRGAEQLRGWIELVHERYPIDRRALVLGGFSQGGAMAYELALRRPDRYAGLAALSSWLPEQLAADLPALPEHQDFPVLITHGTADPLITVERARESRETLRRFGVSITYREFDMGHEIRPDALRVVLRWLQERPFARLAAAAAK